MLMCLVQEYRRVPEPTWNDPTLMNEVVPFDQAHERCLWL